MLCMSEAEDKDRAVAIAISDPLLDDVTILMSAALMAFNATLVPKVQTVSGEPLDGRAGHDNLSNGGGA